MNKDQVIKIGGVLWFIFSLVIVIAEFSRKAF